MSKTRDIIRQHIRSIFRANVIPPIAEWLANKKIKIKGDQNATYAGQYFDSERFPVVAKLVFSFFETPNAFELFAIKPVQSAFTTHVWWALLHRFIYRPCTAILVMHTRQEVRKKMKDTFLPGIKAITELADAKSEDGTESTAEEIRLPGGSKLYIGGGQTASVLTSTHANVVVLDESEQHACIGDTTSANLARGRLSAGDKWRKLIAFSKPEKSAIFAADHKTGKITYIPQQGSFLHAEYCSGNQLRYECRCIHCGIYVEPIFAHISFHEFRITVPGLGDTWDKRRIQNEAFWKCPHCSGAVREGEEKRKWVRDGRWTDTPQEERTERIMYPTAHPGRWSARFSSLTDIAFDSLRFGNIALRFLDAQNNPVSLRAFNNELLGLPEPRIKSEDTTTEQLRRLIPKPGHTNPAPYRIKDARGRLLAQIPLLAADVSYIGMTCDNQKETVKYRVRAVGKDGRSYLLDYGMFPASSGFAELVHYLDTQKFTTIDGISDGIASCYMDVQGTRWNEALDLCRVYAHTGKIVGCAGSGQNTNSTNVVWDQVMRSKAHDAVRVVYFNHNFWAARLYRDCIQHYDPSRHRQAFPAMYFPSDIEDSYLSELMQEREVWKNNKSAWEKLPNSPPNDYGDCEKMGLVQDWLLRGMFEEEERQAQEMQELLAGAQA